MENELGDGDVSLAGLKRTSTVTCNVVIAATMPAHCRAPHEAENASIMSQYVEGTQCR